MARHPKGSQPPKGYVDWHEWAEAQLAHGLKQKWCPVCKTYLFPQEAHNTEHAPTHPQTKPTVSGEQ